MNHEIYADHAATTPIEPLALCLPPSYRLSPFLSGACAPRSTTIILYSLLLIL